MPSPSKPTFSLLKIRLLSRRPQNALFYFYNLLCSSFYSKSRSPSLQVSTFSCRCQTIRGCSFSSSPDLTRVYLTFSVSPRRQDWAARNGQLSVLKWMHTYRREGCTVSAMNWAAEEGHLSVVKWLNNNRQEPVLLKELRHGADFLLMHSTPSTT